ncbi:diacylglycerol kinase (ATP) [Seinonella peptonophila]|uniref:Diacylglycerol kinase (ATP) n=1 Tax=Seinonella peptonophila TaxID=112248 RepID=A0A1M4V787_9BACL|nr:diacylglycerol kinase family protein [Seinonella peptonophila]SHE64792.1 diacylglycerol kinase (ATP) [Seinonella peptonophila]
MWVHKFLKSIGYALEGLKYTLTTQRNMRIHFVIALVVLIISFYLPLNRLEVLILFLSIAMVLFAELLNTVLETIVDMVTQEFHPLAKIAKDVAAGAVLLTVGLAVIVGISIFYPYLNLLFVGVISEPLRLPSVQLAGMIAFTFLFTLMLKGWLSRYNRQSFEPSIAVSIASCIAALITFVIGNLAIAILSYLLVTMLVASRYRMKPDWVPLGMGALIGTAIAIIGVLLIGG